MSEYWKEKLKSIPYKSKGRGRMTKLLKQKSKIGRDTKPRKEYDADLPQPRPRDPPPRGGPGEEHKQGEGSHTTGQGQPNKTNTGQSNEETINNFFNNMAREGD